MSSASLSSLPGPTRGRSSRSPFLILILLATLINTMSAATVTVYTGGMSATTTSLAPGASYTGLGAYDPTTLTPPAPPNPAVSAVSFNVPASPAAAMDADLLVSIPQRGNFLGFSIELSVADSILGQAGTQLKPQFLNYLANIQVRAGQGPVIRVGGNTQEGSTIFADGLADGTELNKIKTLSASDGTVTTVSRSI